MNKEIRAYGNVELRNIEGTETPVISGYALKFNSLSKVLSERKIGSFQEILDPHCLDGVLERSTVYAVYNHQLQESPFPPLARYTYGDSTSTLKLEVDDQGLRFEFTPDDSVLAQSLANAVKNQVCRDCSFAFTVNPKDEVWTRDANDMRIRTIKQIDRLFDVTICCTGAYNTTEVYCDTRAFDEVLAEEERVAEEQRAAEEAAAQEAKEKHAQYIADLKAQIHK